MKFNPLGKPPRGFSILNVLLALIVAGAAVALLAPLVDPLSPSRADSVTEQIRQIEAARRAEVIKNRKGEPAQAVTAQSQAP